VARAVNDATLKKVGDMQMILDLLFVIKDTSSEELYIQFHLHLHNLLLFDSQLCNYDSCNSTEL